MKKDDFQREEKGQQQNNSNYVHSPWMPWMPF